MQPPSIFFFQQFFFRKLQKKLKDPSLFQYRSVCYMSDRTKIYQKRKCKDALRRRQRNHSVSRKLSIFGMAQSVSFDVTLLLIDIKFRYPFIINAHIHSI